MQRNDFSHHQVLNIDRQMLWILLAHTPVVGMLVPTGFGTHRFALIASVVLGALVLLAYGTLRGSRGFSAIVAAALMAFSAIMIQSRLGQIEMHFHIFAALALLMAYRDWLPIVIGAATIAVHHFVLTGLQLGGAELAGMPLMVYSYDCSWSIAFLHAAFVVFESSILVFFAIRLGQERQVTHGMMHLVGQFNEQQDLRGRLQMENDLSARAFNSLLDQFSALIAHIAGLADTLCDNADTLAAGSARSNEIIDRQGADLAQAAAATAQMSTTVQGVARHARQAAEASHLASRAAEDGRFQVGEAVNLTEATDTSLTEASGAVRSLVDTMTSIDQVISSIDGISEQTNLLALNAAIEAARAGQHGLGFAVVADEVRNLSRRTQMLTHEVRDAIGVLSEGARTALDAIDLGLARSQETTIAIRLTGDAIGAIDEAVTKLTALTHQIASASAEQTAASDQINISVQDVAARNRNVLDQADAVRTLAVGLNSLVADIRGLVSNYRIKNKTGKASY